MIKVGDRVRVIRGSDRYLHRTGTVVSVYGDLEPFHWLVEFPGGDTGLFEKNEIIEVP